MSFDVLALAAIRDEIHERAVGGRVQRIVLPSRLALGLEIYAGKRQQLLVNADPREPGILFVSHRLRRGTETPTPLALLLRKYLQGARLEQVEQPHLERILIMTFVGEEGLISLVCEIMGRHSNAILVDSDGVILDALKRIPPSLNRYRTILPHQDYIAPPRQDKQDPFLLTQGTLKRLLEASGEELLWRGLTSSVAGVSPLAAREVVHRATGRPDTQCSQINDGQWAAMVTALQDLYGLLETRTWQPTVGFEDLDRSIPSCFAPYPLTHCPSREPAEGISVAAERVLTYREGADPYGTARARLLGLIENAEKRVQSRLASLRSSLVDEAELENLRALGNAILAMSSFISAGQEELEVEPGLLGCDHSTSDKVRIPLDPRYTPAENAQAIFRRYQKLKSAAEEVPQLVRQAELELEYLGQLRTDAMLASDRPGLDAVEAQLEEMGYKGRGTRTKVTRREPLSVRADDGTLILVGRNSRENDELTFELASPDDLWLHARGVPGSHVIVRSGGRHVSEETLRLAAGLAAYYSAARGENVVRVDYTDRRHVHRIKGAPPGLVTYDHERTLVVAPCATGSEQQA